MDNLRTIIIISLLTGLMTLLLLTDGVGQEIQTYGTRRSQLNGTFFNLEGNLAICGAYANGGEINDPRMWLMEVDNGGDVLINSVYNDLGSRAEGNDLIEVEGGGYLIGGRIAYDQNSHSFAAIRTDDEGDVIWSNDYNPEDEHYNWNGRLLRGGSYTKLSLGKCFTLYLCCSRCSFT
jgi:hypothetical protein